jgi:NitT/TauT family transport system substrate-binding protein
MTADFIAKNPRTVQAIVTAFVRTLKWMSVHAGEDIATAVPQEYALGNREVYVRALAASEAMYSPNGRFVPGAVETAYQVLKVFDPSVAGATVDLSKTYTNTFVEKALAAN